MKCPHCNQEHEDGKKFCPNTGEKIISTLVSCPNPDCVNYGKKVLLSNYQFCDECGTALNNDAVGAGSIENIDWKKLFPVDKVWLGDTNIFEIEPDALWGMRLHCSKNGYWFFKDISKKHIGYHQNYGNDFITCIYYSDELPKKWEELLGFNCGVSYDQVIKSIDGKGDIITDCIVDGDKVIRFITNDKQYLLCFRFAKERNQLDFVAVETYCCPHCGSLEIEMNENSYMCGKCHFKWGRAYRCHKCDSENIECSETHFLCKDCGYEINLES